MTNSPAQRRLLIKVSSVTCYVLITVRSLTTVSLLAITTHTHTHPFNGPLSGTTRVSRYQKSKTNLNFTGARDSEWQCHQLGHMQVCTSLQTDNHASTSPLFLQAGCPSCRPTNSVKALKAKTAAKNAINVHTFCSLIFLSKL